MVARLGALLAAAALLPGCGEGADAAKPAAAPAAATATAKSAAPAIDARKVDAAVRAVESYLAADKPSEAMTVAERLAAEAPGLMRAHELHARALVALALHPDMPREDRAAVLARAADAYANATALDPANGALQHAAGVVCDTAGRHEEAVAHYEAALAAQPTNAQFALYLGLARARDGRAPEARALLEQAERALPDAPEPKAALADLAMRANDLPRAREWIAQARRLAPASIEFRLADARMRRLAGAPRESLELLLPLDRAAREHPGVAEEIGAAYTALGSYREAAQALEESAGAAPNDWLRAVRAAEAWMRAGDPVKATIWSEAASLVGAPPERVQAAMQTAPGAAPGAAAPATAAPVPHPGG